MVHACALTMRCFIHMRPLVACHPAVIRIHNHVRRMSVLVQAAVSAIDSAGVAVALSSLSVACVPRNVYGSVTFLVSRSLR